MGSATVSSVDFSEADVTVAESYLEKLYSEGEQKGFNFSSDHCDDDELQSIVNSMMSMKEAEWIATSAIENPAIFEKLLEYSFFRIKNLHFVHHGQ